MHGTTLTIFLPQGDPNGLRILRKSHWTGVAVMVSRAEYNEVKSREEFGRTSVYLLIGPDDDDPARSAIYIGEADVFRNRVIDHFKKDDMAFWTDMIVFSKSDGALSKGDVRQLEAALIAKARAAKRYRVRNTNNPSPPPPDEQTQADLDSLLDDMLVIYRILGVHAFEEAQLTSGPDQLLKLEFAGASATGERTVAGLIVRKGSRALKAEQNSLSDGYRQLRNTLVENGVLAPDGDYLVFTQDYVFTSPTAAADVVYGGSISGPQFWRYASSGESLRERDEKEAVEQLTH